MSNVLRPGRLLSIALDRGKRGGVYGQIRIGRSGVRRRQTVIFFFSMEPRNTSYKRLVARVSFCSRATSVSSRVTPAYKAYPCFVGPPSLITIGIGLSRETAPALATGAQSDSRAPLERTMLVACPPILPPRPFRWLARQCGCAWLCNHPSLRGACWS